MCEWLICNLPVFLFVVEDAFILLGGSDAGEESLVLGATVYLPEGRTCPAAENGIPDSPEEVNNACLVATESALLQCGGYKFKESSCKAHARDAQS